MVYRGLVTVVLALALVGCNEARETTLSNGLKVIVKEDHRSPVVVSQVWYKVGSSYEPEGLTGISHVLEHMMFKGTTEHKAGEFSRIIAANGGRENAFTGDDYTAYFQQLEKSRLPISFELEADRMRNLLLQEDQFKRELQVVMEERRMRTDDQPQALTYERFMATAYTKSPYHHPVIGWMRDLEHLTVRDVRDWYHRWYVPNNATIVVVGDVKPDEVFALAKKYFGAIPARPVPLADASIEPAQQTPRRTTVSAPAEVPYLLLGYHAPVLTGGRDREQYALDVISGILAGGQSARFARELIRGQRVAASVDASYDAATKYPPMFLVSGVPAAGHDVADVQRAVLAQVERLQTQRVSDAELERVKAQVIAQDIYGQDSVFGQAMLIGMFDTVGLDWRLRDRYVDNIRRVTADDVQAAARKYLNEHNMTVAILNPLPIDRSVPRPAVPEGGGHVR